MRRRGTSGTPWRILSLRILLQPILQHSAHNLHPGVLNWTQLNRTEFCGFCPRVGRKYHLPSRLPPGCFLLSTLDRDQVNTGEETSVMKQRFLTGLFIHSWSDLLTGQPWRNPHTALVAPSGAKFQTMVGLLTHYHRYCRETSFNSYSLPMF